MRIVTAIALVTCLALAGCFNKVPLYRLGSLDLEALQERLVRLAQSDQKAIPANPNAAHHLALTATANVPS